MRNNDIDLFFGDKPGTVQDVEVPVKICCSNHRVRWYKVRLNPKRKRGTQAELMKPMMEYVKVRKQELKITLQEKVALLAVENDDSVDSPSGNLTREITESAAAIADLSKSKETGKLTHKQNSLF